VKKIVALNLKMNLSYDEALEYVETIKNNISDVHEIIFFPGYLYLEMFKKSGYKIGAQNVHYLDKGAFTGEISPLQLKSLGIPYALVGHSERRIYFKEDDTLFNNKIKGCLRNNLRVILCVGETDEERRLKKTAFILEKQIENALKDIDRSEIEDIIIAYEPVWAIGSGKTPEIEDIEDATAYIKKIILRDYGVESKVLYGGSVNKDNIKHILNIKNLDGVLVGSASNDPKNLISMLDLID
jgi:triosephosphate isomerase